MKFLLLAASSIVCLSGAVQAQMYMDPRTGTVYNGFGLPASGPSPSRVLDYQTTPSWNRNYIRQDGGTTNGWGLPTSGPNPRNQMCLQNPGLC